MYFYNIFDLSRWTLAFLQILFKTVSYARNIIGGWQKDNFVAALTIWQISMRSYNIVLTFYIVKSHDRICLWDSVLIVDHEMSLYIYIVCNNDHQMMILYFSTHIYFSYWILPNPWHIIRSISYFEMLIGNRWCDNFLPTIIFCFLASEIINRYKQSPILNESRGMIDETTTITSELIMSAVQSPVHSN